jgi:cytidylate kinase
MYRTVTRRAHEESIDPSDEAGVARIAENLSFYLDQSGADWILSEHGTPLSHEMLHSPVIDRDVSAVSAHPAVRREMVRQQREMAGGNGIVMLGRDIGTVVLPEAPVKLFVTASPEVRGRRRHLQRASEVHDETDTLRDIRARDSWDQSRPVSPLKAADGAVVIDTSSKTAQESLEQALSAVSQALDKTTALNG